jgi:hypothetical protein
MNILGSNICTAIDRTGVIGSKVTHPIMFLGPLYKAVEKHDFSADRIPGQGFIQLPEAVSFVSAGVGHPTKNPEDYVLREYRGKVSAFLKREFAATTEGCAVVVYTTEAYLADPDITPEEAARIKNWLALPSFYKPVSHVLVAVLAFAGPPSQLSPHRFTANLAGGNHEAQVWTADEIRAKAKAIMAVENDWTTVADPV